MKVLRLIGKTRSGVKFLFFILAFLLFVPAGAAPVKLAVVGRAEWVDPATAELSKGATFDLLERSAIADVLKEHRLTLAGLSGTQLAKLFPHADLFAVVGERSIVVFNAVNGFRLADRDHGGKVEIICGEIRRAAAKIAVKDAVCVSTVAVRDIGVPRRFKEKLEEVVTGVERCLLDDPRIQVLERSRLGLVGAERELAGINFQLTPSACLLTFEFEPDGSGKQLNLQVRLQDLARKELGVIRVSPLPGNPERAVVDDILRQLPGAAATSDKRAEAQRFARESEELFRNEQYREALNRIQAALTLEEKSEYRLTELKTLSKLCCAMPWNPARIRATAELLPVYERFASGQAGNRELREAFLAVSDVFTMNGFFEYPESEEELAQVCAEYRRLRRLARERFCPSSLPGEMRTLNDLRQYNGRIRLGTFLLMPDLKGELEETLETNRALFPAVIAFLERNPNEKERVERLLQARLGLLMCGERARRKEWAPYIRQILPTVELLEESDITTFRHECLAIRFLLRILDKPRTVEAVTPEIDRYLRELEACEPGSIAKIAQRQGWGRSLAEKATVRALYFLTEHTGGSNLQNAGDLVGGRAAKLNTVHDRYAPLYTTITGMSKSVTAEGLDQLIKAEGLLRELAAERIHSRQTNSWFARLMEALSEEESDSTAIARRKKRLFALLNRDLQVRSVSWGELSGKTSVFCLGTCVSGNRLFAVLRGPDSYLLTEITLPDRLRVICQWPELNVLRTRLYPKSGSSVYLAADGDLVAVADRDSLWIVDAATGKMNRVEDPLGGIFPSGLAAAGGRIYLLGSGRTAYAGEMRTREKRNGTSSLLSCNAAGEDRVIHFSTTRLEKKNQPDHTGGQAELYTELQVLDADRLVFHSENAVWEFDWRKNSFSPLASFSAGNYIRSTVLNGALFLTTTQFANQFQTIEPPEYKPYPLLGFSSQPPRLMPLCLLPEAFLQTDSTYMFRNSNILFFREGNRLLLAGARPFVLDLAQPEKSPILLLPECFNLHKVGREIVFVGNSGLFSLPAKGEKR